MFRSKPPRHSHPLSSTSRDPPTDLPRVRKRVPWRRVKSSDSNTNDQPTESVSDESVSGVPSPSAASSGASGNNAHNTPHKPGPLKRLSTIFKEGDSRTEENLKSLKRRVVQVRRQPDEAPVRFQLGFRSRTGWEPIRAVKENQDCLVALVPWGPNSRYNLFAALDGHGRNGHQCAIFVAQKFVGYLNRYLAEDSDMKHIANTMHKACAYAERKLESPSVPVDYQLSGSTGVFVLVHGTTLFCANVGDSRAVLGREKQRTSNSAGSHSKSSGHERPMSEHTLKHTRKRVHGANLVQPDYIAVALSVDQKPSRPDEKERLLQAGARVDAWDCVDVGEDRVWLPEARTPGLAVSRSFGDLLVKRYGVDCTPEVHTLELCEDDRFMVMASDGVFEFVSSEEVVDVVGRWRERGSAQEAAEELVKLATERWIDDDSVIDDISCVVVFMNVVSPKVLEPKDPVHIETDISSVDGSGEVNHTSDLKNLPYDDQQDTVELVTPSSSETPLRNAKGQACTDDFDDPLVNDLDGDDEDEEIVVEHNSLRDM